MTIHVAQQGWDAERLVGVEGWPRGITARAGTTVTLACATGERHAVRSARSSRERGIRRVGWVMLRTLPKEVDCCLLRKAIGMIAAAALPWEEPLGVVG